MKVGTTIQVEISERRDGYLKAECDGNRFSIAGEGSVGDTRNVRVIKKQRGTFIAVTKGAILRLMIDEVVDESTVKANPSYGPVLIQPSLSQGTLSQGNWYQCVVTKVRDDSITAKTKRYIPRNSDIPRGSPPEDPTQSLNHLLSEGKL